MLVEDDAFIILQVAGLILPKQKLLLTLVFLDSLLYFFFYICHVMYNFIRRSYILGIKSYLKIQLKGLLFAFFSYFCIILISCFIINPQGGGIYWNQTPLDLSISCFSWPICDCLIAFHSSGYPLEKAQAYAALRK